MANNLPAPVDTPAISQSLEDYLETIYLAAAGGGVVRVTDIAERMAVTRPSVVRALRELSAAELVLHAHYGSVALTDRGEREALRIFSRHSLLKRFLGEILHVSEENAERDACRMEHILSTETLARIEALLSRPGTRTRKTACLPN